MASLERAIKYIITANPILNAVALSHFVNVFCNSMRSFRIMAVCFVIWYKMYIVAVVT